MFSILWAEVGDDCPRWAEFCFEPYCVHTRLAQMLQAQSTSHSHKEVADRWNRKRIMATAFYISAAGATSGTKGIVGN